MCCAVDYCEATGVGREVSEVNKVPLLVEVIGEPSSGKTHLSSLFPKPALFDTTPKGEGYVILKKLYPEEWKMRYFRIYTFDDFTVSLNFVKTKGEFFKTVVVDTSVDLRALGAKAWLKLHKDRERLMPEEWGWVNVKVDDLVTEVTNQKGACMNLVLTSQMQDEWLDRKTTGRRIRKGVPTMNFQADIRLFLLLKQKADPQTMQLINEYERICRVLKNRFRDQANKEEWVSDLKELSWKGIKELTKLGVGEVIE